MKWIPERLRESERGATLVEFAIIAPVMILVIMGLCDLMYQAYVQAILTGAVQKAARDSSIQGGADKTDTLDAAVLTLVHDVAPQATKNSSRLSYSGFGQMHAERIDDNNKNGVLDKGDCFYDVNGNKTWDADPGLTGQGGANDVTLYTMTITYPRLFPMMGLLGWSAFPQATAKTLIKNQPYKNQVVPPVVQICL